MLRAFGSDVWWGDTLTVSQIHKSFDEQGQLIDAALQERLTKFIADFAAHIRK